MMNACKAFLLDNASSWKLPLDGKWNCLFSNNYHPNYSTAALLWFHDKDQFPRVVTKVFPSGEIPQREFDNLKRVYARAPERVPEPLHFGGHGGRWGLWMAGVQGYRLPARAATSSQGLLDVVGLISDLHIALRNPVPPEAAERRERLVVMPLQTVAAFGDAAPVRRACAELQSAASPEWLRSLPSIPQHGDLFSDNILVTAREWKIVDWESFGLVDIPFYDVFTCILSALRQDGETPSQWSRDVLARIPQLTALYSRSIGLLPEDVRILLPLTLANWFQLQWADGRVAFAESMYRTIQHYAEHTAEWESVFRPLEKTTWSHT